MYPSSDSLVDQPCVKDMVVTACDKTDGGLNDQQPDFVVSPNSWTRRKGVGTLELKNTFISLRLLDPVEGVIGADSDEESPLELIHHASNPVCAFEHTRSWPTQYNSAYRRERSCPAALKGGVCELVNDSSPECAIDGASLTPSGVKMSKTMNQTLSYSPTRTGRVNGLDYNYRSRRSSRGLVTGSRANNNDRVNSSSLIGNSNGPPSSTDTRSTVMLRNIPYSMGQMRVLDALLSMGFQSKIDFFYAPLDFSSGNNLGYAFINLRRPEYVDEFYNKFNDVSLSHLGEAWCVKRLKDLKPMLHTIITHLLSTCQRVTVLSSSTTMAAESLCITITIANNKTKRSRST
ncbi:hypothetical protein Pmar_PMAR023221 [Perkinsus marinus ATCC 50983]|uniref:Mei2-like C-terminal RNA recognition motif domain-containing protein n=1 Tax=Perkinsus marinus (strain ATCC 50983 / TXsc) TaxID=423536 RepID=C5LJI0_PERM5|nr:hypothetical protein Pmar_PMAR023221 [Perkinsus marinus ATCC 50983]EER03109.1 hypothetical protein Pmar_PMAR023221 [Perkinsus marinus ATCC 50983]|eukprot:XP_002771293.1 hypothetical protein Pmar_PMAR023221 [Perkinsus marinus ATCC 50983]